VPRAAKGKQEADIDPDGIYTAWQAGSADIDGLQYTVTTGERRRGSDPMVQAHPWLVVVDGTPEAERPASLGADVVTPGVPLQTARSAAVTPTRKKPSDGEAQDRQAERQLSERARSPDQRQPERDGAATETLSAFKGAGAG
jgi:hypothetical protein